MKNTDKKLIKVFADWAGVPKTMMMGTLQSDRLRGKEVFSFEYQDEWLRAKQTHLLDPELQFFSGKHYLNSDYKPNFGLFLDSSPDRWGRVLMKRKEAMMARRENRPEKTLLESDFLLGVYDEYRLGALRFKLNEDEPFLNNDPKLACPPWTSLKELETASWLIEQETEVDDLEYIKWLGMLIAPGASLGGARPKASISGKDDGLWLAKFPSRNDQNDVGGWEAVTYQLAINAGIRMAPSIAIKLSSRFHTFVTKRFDRTSDNKRLHFASAMTLLGYNDGTNHTDGVSYLEIVDFLMKNGSQIEQDLHELWRRIVFNICVSNTDDHLRNHGFILTEKGWALSPAYDINPIETGTGLSLNISETDHSLDLDLAMEVHEYFRLNENKAIAIIQEVKNSVKKWKLFADKIGIPKFDQEMKSKAFKNAYL